MRCATGSCGSYTRMYTVCPGKGPLYILVSAVVTCTTRWGHLGGSTARTTTVNEELPIRPGWRRLCLTRLFPTQSTYIGTRNSDGIHVVRSPLSPQLARDRQLPQPFSIPPTAHCPRVSPHPRAPRTPPASAPSPEIPPNMPPAIM